MNTQDSVIYQHVCNGETSHVVFAVEESPDVQYHSQCPTCKLDVTIQVRLKVDNG